MNTEQVKQFDSIFNALSESLDITETQYEAAVRSYRAVGDWLAKADSVLVSYNPIIRAQGSFMLGTMIRPLNEQDDLDIDLVCELTGKGASWTQYDLKHKVGNRLKDHETYKRMLDEEGRRCWTLKYAQESNYHMDILPCLVAKDYKTVMERSFSASLGAIRGLDNLAIRITDKESANYRYDPSPENWMKSNPFGYGIWFIQRATAGDRQKMMLLAESVRAVPKYQSNKTPLQRAVQILKRHRDIMFAGDEDKPVSIIITTLAAKAYQGEGSITEALQTILIHMDKYILNEFDPQSGKTIKKVENPVNPEENFADKWIEHPKRQDNFYKWLEKVRKDLSLILQLRGMHVIAESMMPRFGRQAVSQGFDSLAEKARSLRESGTMKMAAGSGILGSAGSVSAKAHHFFGNHE